MEDEMCGAALLVFGWLLMLSVLLHRKARTLLSVVF